MGGWSGGGPFGDGRIETVQHRLGHQPVCAERGRHRNTLSGSEIGNPIGDLSVRKEPRRDDDPVGAPARKTVGGCLQ